MMKQSLICGMAAMTVFVCVAIAASGGQETGAMTTQASSLPEAGKSGAADGQQSPALTGNRRPLYRLQKSDVIDISFTFSPEFNQERTIQPDGFITLLGTSPLIAEGLTVSELQAALGQRYGAFLNEPEINIVLKDFNRPYFTAIGEVNHPGKYELRADTTVTEALAIAGGINGQAKHSQIVLFRKISDEAMQAKVIDVKQMLNSRNLKEDSYLKTGDFLYVPKSTLAKIKQYLPSSSLSLYMSPTQF
jgi:polysaccharide export outer membrane protein